ncbi:MAG: mechanosensitive ion channel [Pseudomonadota bacterium]|nr:mechanosensitive ion channel [Pseudomonadota bacterium]
MSRISDLVDLTLAKLKDSDQLLDLALPVLGNIVAALAIFYIGKWIAALLLRLMRQAMARARVDETLASFISNVLYGLALAVVVIAALGRLGVETTSAAAILGGMALAIGLSLQGQLSSLAAGVILIVFRPFKRGDVVSVGGTVGTVEEIRIVHTVLTTGDNQIVYVPNSNITTTTITNYSARRTRRIDLTIGIAYDSDLRKAKQLLQLLLAEEPRGLPKPAATVEVKELTDKTVNFAVRLWVKTDDWWLVQCELVERIKLQFDANGIEIPSPPRAVQLEGLQGLLKLRKEETG